VKYWPEKLFFVLVILVPLAVLFLWRSSSILRDLAAFGIAMVSGLGLWVTLMFAIGAVYDREKRAPDA
jgi:hypothetical protein